MAKSNIFFLNKENFSEVTAEIHERLTKTKATKNEIMMANLLLEEIFMRVTQNGIAQEIKAFFKKRLNSAYLQIEYNGKKYNPFKDDMTRTDKFYEDEEEEFFRSKIINMYRSKTEYSYEDDKNIVVIEYHRKSLLRWLTE